MFCHVAVEKAEERLQFNLMLQRISINLLNVYQRYIRIRLPYSCRFIPSCSDYAKQAIIKYGFCKGAVKAATRLMQCHPFSGKAADDPLE